jgi:hypothetical protein
MDQDPSARGCVQRDVSAALRPVGFHCPIQAQRGKAWDEPQPATASNVMCPRPYGRSAFTAPSKPNAVRRGTNRNQTLRPT